MFFPLWLQVQMFSTSMTAVCVTLRNSSTSMWARAKKYLVLFFLHRFWKVLVWMWWKSGVTWQAHLTVNLSLSTCCGNIPQLGQPETTMFVTLALIAPSACSWPVTHRWSVLSAPWAPVTGSRLIVSAENKRGNDCWGRTYTVVNKMSDFVTHTCKCGCWHSWFQYFIFQR